MTWKNAFLFFPVTNKTNLGPFRVRNRNGGVEAYKEGVKEKQMGLTCRNGPFIITFPSTLLSLCRATFLEPSSLASLYIWNVDTE